MSGSVDSLPPELRELASRVPQRRIERCLALLDRRDPGVVVVVEAVRRRHNVSAILRSAEAFGVHEVHLVAGRFRPARGAARGSERWLELRFLPSVDASLGELRSRGFATYVADIDPGAVGPRDLPLDRPVALLFGAELSGVSPRARELADGVVCVPMRGITQSLNVSVAAAVLLHVLCERRRRAHGVAGIRGQARLRFARAFIEREIARRKAGEAIFGQDRG